MSKVIRQFAGAALAAAVAVCAVRADELETARAALHDKLYRVAQAHAEKALAGESPDQALLVLLEALAGQGLYAEMSRRLDGADGVERQAPLSPPFAYWRAVALLSTGHPLDAARVAEAAKGEASPYADALRRVAARAKVSAGDLPGALVLYAEADRTSTNRLTRAANALEWAVALERAGKADAALEVLKLQAELGVVGEAVSDGMLMRGRLLVRQGKHAEATMVFNQLAMSERATELARVQALVEMSVYAMSAGKTNEA
ncbi:MAG: hypothetical protein PHV28_16330, partial [Kiritimatiellae bacterium]|nr:hypothetical protein [Kiritimatiellia bacterium]